MIKFFIKLLNFRFWDKEYVVEGSVWFVRNNFVNGNICLFYYLDFNIKNIKIIVFKFRS